jgi:Ca2+:H+ antiporter
LQTIEEPRFSIPPARPSASFFREEWPLAVSIATAGLFLAFGDHWLAELSGFAWFAFLLAWLFVVILLSAFAVVRHAEHLAHQLGEPLGTLILTLAVTGIEVMMIGSVMYAAGEKSSVARDAMFAVVMIVLNGMVGLSLLLGGLRYGEQTYNLQGANAFLAVIVPLAVLGLILPNFTVATPGPTLSRSQSIFLSVMSAGLYAVFVAIQNRRHRDYFRMPAYPDAAPAGDGENHERERAERRIVFQFVLLLAYLLPVVVLSEKLAIPLDYAVRQMGAPPALGGLFVAILILSPESLAAIRAAMANELQRSINILLGSVLATIGLTIPSVLAVGFFTGHSVILGLNQANMVLLMLTLVLSTLTFGSSRTNVLQGAVHLLLFLAYLVFLFDR